MAIKIELCIKFSFPKSRERIYFSPKKQNKKFKNMIVNFKNEIGGLPIWA